MYLHADGHYMGRWFLRGKLYTCIHILCIVTVAFSSFRCAREEEKEAHFTIGVVTNNRNGLRNIEGFKDAMAELGYVEGDNVTYVTEGNPVTGDNLIAFLEDAVRRDVDLIFTAGTPTGVAAKRSTENSSVPVVFGVIADPIAAGVMTDLRVPNGNLTGIMLSSNQDRRFELLIELDPDIRTVFVPYNPDDPAPVSAVGQIRNLAPKLGVRIIEGHARTSDQALALIQSIPDDVDAVFMLPDSTVNQHIEDLVAVADERKLPISGPSMTQLEDGALIAYGIVHARVGAQAARIADHILKGSDPGKIPVETAEVYLGINLDAAQRIGIDIPADFIRQAEIIIRDDGRQ